LKGKSIREHLRSLAQKPSHFDQLQMAERAEVARLLVHESANLPKRRVESSSDNVLWRECIDAFNKCLSEAYPRGFWDDFELLRNGDSSGLESAISFLEADPFFFRSGYVKADLLRLVCRFELSEQQKLRLQRVVINAVMLRDRREFRQFANLGRQVQSKNFAESLTQLLQHDDPAVRRRAQWVLESL
jgi:hypothetical protein